MFLRGDKSLLKKLDALAGKDMKASVRKGTRAGCKIINKESKKLCPKNSGNLKKNLKVRSGKRSRKVISSVVNLKDVPYLSFPELGTKFQDAQGFMKQATANKKEEAGKAVTDAMLEEIKKRSNKK